MSGGQFEFVCPSARAPPRGPSIRADKLTKSTKSISPTPAFCFTALPRAEEVVDEDDIPGDPHQTQAVARRLFMIMIAFMVVFMVAFVSPPHVRCGYLSTQLDCTMKASR